MRISDWSSDVCSSDLEISAHNSRPKRAGTIGRPALPVAMAGGEYCSRSASKCDRGTNGISERTMRQASHAVASARAMPAAKETESGSPGRSHATSNPNAAKSTGKEHEQTETVERTRVVQGKSEDVRVVLGGH